MLRKEVALFFFVGTVTVLIDFLSYKTLLFVELVGIDAAKAISFCIGTVFAYFANKSLTFAAHKSLAGSFWRFVFVYSCTLLVNVSINSQILNLLRDTALNFQIAFVLATGVSAGLNFFCMKLFVFRAAVGQSKP
ncbi:GtrA family protein [Undibacterium sp. Di26W]|uniref:GtrA family protein n=1 Tax=Undibacterium sp. Di26W TaxID=3413035 RepID=UPI003BF4163C